MGFFEDLLRGATAPGVMQNGMNIGISGMAEAQRRKEEQALIQRQQEQQAFANMMAQRNYGLNERIQGFAETQYQEGEPLRSAELGYRTAATNKMNAEYDPNNPITSADLKYKEAQAYRLMHPVDTNISAAESWNQGLSNLTPEEQSNAYRIKYGLSPKATSRKEITQQDVADIYMKMMSEYDSTLGDPPPTVQDALRVATDINNAMNPQPLKPPPPGGAALMQGIYGGQPKPQQIAPMGAQGQPVTMSGGQAQPQMNRAAMLKQKFDADPSSLTPEEFDELGQYLNGGN